METLRELLDDAQVSRYEKLFGPLIGRRVSPTPAETGYTEAFMGRLLTALAEGPIGDHILELCEGRRQLVVLQRHDRQGWIVRTEPVEEKAP